MMYALSCGGIQAIDWVVWRHKEHLLVLVVLTKELVRVRMHTQLQVPQGQQGVHQREHPRRSRNESDHKGWVQHHNTRCTCDPLLDRPHSRHCRKVSACRISHAHDRLRGGPEHLAVLDGPAVRVEALIDGDGEGVLRRERVVDADDGTVDRLRPVPEINLVRSRRLCDEAPPVKVHDEMLGRRQRLPSLPRHARPLAPMSLTRFAAEKPGTDGARGLVCLVDVSVVLPSTSVDRNLHVTATVFRPPLHAQGLGGVDRDDPDDLQMRSDHNRELCRDWHLSEIPEGLDERNVLGSVLLSDARGPRLRLKEVIQPVEARHRQLSQEPVSLVC
mmetsp:Transcript_57936/g.142118  ORF Transcript_57936/g.142118 Transcript_57936/m.142118 type:complete len:331 (+) Transcript_57936:442-1434(+)